MNQRMETTTNQDPSSVLGGLFPRRGVILNVVAPVLAFVVIVAGMEFFIDYLGIQKWILPPPSSIFSTMVSEFVPEILPHAIATVKVILIGFLIGTPIGIVLAALLAEFILLARAFDPYIILIVMTPLITLVPLLMTWLGFGALPKVIAVAIQTFPIIVLNAATGFKDVDPLKLELMESLGASRLQTFLKVKLPSGLPHVFTGVKLGGIFATIAAISAEFVGGDVGLGSRIVHYTNFIKTDLAFVCIITVSVIGVGLYTLISIVENLVIRWEM